MKINPILSIKSILHNLKAWSTISGFHEITAFLISIYLIDSDWRKSVFVIDADPAENRLRTADVRLLRASDELVVFTSIFSVVSGFSGSRICQFYGASAAIELSLSTATT